MGTKGLIGDVHARFSADTEGFKKNVGSAAQSLRAVGKAAEASAAIVTEASAKMEVASRAGAKAHERALQAWGREQEANALAASRASQAAAASKELAHAQELAALKTDILARSEEEAALSTNLMIRSMQKVRIAAEENFGAVGEKLAQVAERAELSADGIASAFGGLGALLGGGFAVAFAAHALDNLAELNVELGDLHEKTGLGVQDLAGLRLMALSKGLNFTMISTGLTRLASSLMKAQQGSKADVDAFTSLGFTMKELPTTTVEQAFYRIATATGKYRSVILTTGTAQQLFGRGGKELVPILQAYGAGLEEEMKRQGALTKITDKSVAASQKWLQTTTDLNAQLHGGMVPALEDIVATLPFIQSGLRFLQAGFDVVFEGATMSIDDCTYATAKLYEAMQNIAKFNPHAAFEDLKSVWENAKSNWLGVSGAVKKHWNEGLDDEAAGLYLSGADGDAYGMNHPANPEGALTSAYGPAQQKLAEMEISAKKKGKPMSAQQIIAYWQGVQKGTTPGSANYMYLNNLIAGYMEDPSRAASLPKSKNGSGSSGIGSSGMLSASRAWNRQRQQYAADRATAIREALIPPMGPDGKTQPFTKDERGAIGTSLASQDHVDLSRSTSATSALVAQGRQSAAWAQSQVSMRAAMRKTSDAMDMMQIRAAAAHGAITKLDGAVAIAAIHQRQYSETMADFAAQIQSIQTGLGGAGMTPMQKKTAITNVEIARNSYQTSATRTAQQDAQATGQWQPGSTMVAVRNALDEFVMAVGNTSGQIGDLVGSAITGTNEALSRALMAHTSSGQEYRRGITNALGGQVRELGTRGLNMGMGDLEGGVLKAFGFGKGKRGDSATTPLYVMDVSGAKGAAAAGGAVGAIAGLAGSSVAKAAGGGSSSAAMVESIAAKIMALFPRFASGGTIYSGMASIVGENGPEMFIPRMPGTIVPNNKLMGNVTHHHHHYNIDARGAHDPAAVEEAVRRGIAKAAPGIVGASVSAVHDHARRIPTMKR